MSQAHLAAVARSRYILAMTSAVLVLAPPTASALTAISPGDIARFERQASPEDLQVPPIEPECGLSKPGAERAPAAECMRCHALHRTHPVELDYAAAAAREPRDYATAEEVVRAGVFLLDGQVRCVTCHDQRSPWKYKLALPPGAVATPSVNTLSQRELESASRSTRPAVPLPAGSEVTQTPLCLSCHRL